MKPARVLSTLVVTAVFVTLLPASASAVQRCFGRTPSIVGTEGRDVIRGTAGSDVIVSLGGNDTITGRDGDDFICMGFGNDAVLGREGKDRIRGEAGHDYLGGDQGRDVLVGGPGNDRIEGGRSPDSLFGGPGHDDVRGGGEGDELRGDDGNDVVIGGSGNDSTYGGDGHDLVDGTQDNDRLDGGRGFDYAGFLLGDNRVEASLITGAARGQGTDALFAVEGLIGSDLSDVLEGNDRVNWIYGGKGIDRLEGEDGDDRLAGEEARDHLIGGAGHDVLDGGPDSDTCVGGEDLLACEKESYFLTVSTDYGRVTSAPAGIDCNDDCEEPVQPGDQFVLTAHETPEGKFVQWWGGPCHQRTDLTCEFVVDSDVHMFAIFRFTPRLDVEVAPSEGGTVTDESGGIVCGADCSEHYDSGTDVRLTAAPADGWRFGGWSGCTSAWELQCVVHMDRMRSVSATFARQYQLVVSKAGDGTGTVTSSPAGIDCGTDCDHPYDAGSSVTLTATPDQGSVFTGWGGDCAGEVGDTCTVVLDQARTVSAAFESPLP